MIKSFKAGGNKMIALDAGFLPEFKLSWKYAPSITTEEISFVSSFYLWLGIIGFGLHWWENEEEEA